MIRKDILPSITRLSYRIDGFKGFDTKNDINSNSLDKCSYGYNISFKNGVLKHSYGVEYAKYGDGLFPCTSGNGIKKLHLYKYFDSNENKFKEELLAVDFGNGLSKAKVGDFFFTRFENIYFDNDNPTFINFRLDDKDVVLIFSVSGNMYVYDGNTLSNFFNIPKFKSACLHFGRVFGVDAEETNKLCFCKAYDPRFFKVEYGGGFINIIDGGENLNKVISFKDYVYLFKDYSIYRLTAYSQQEDFKVVKILDSGSYILPETITICEDKIIYFTKEGMYMFDGFNSVQIFQESFDLIESLNKCTGLYFNNKLFVCLRMKTDDEEIGDEAIAAVMFNNAIFVYDLLNGEISVARGTDIVNFLGYNSDKENNRLLCCFGNHRRNFIGEIEYGEKMFDKNIKKLWRSPKTNLNNMSKKITIKKSYIDSKFPCSFNIKQENDNIREVEGGKTTESTYITNGDNVQLEIITDGELQVNGIQLEFNLVRRQNGQ